jgi:hypothetical protein
MCNCLLHIEKNGLSAYIDEALNDVFCNCETLDIPRRDSVRLVAIVLAYACVGVSPENLEMEDRYPESYHVILSSVGHIVLMAKMAGYSPNAFEESLDDISSNWKKVS